MLETDTLRRIQLALSDGSTRLWRNNVGEAWLGRSFTIRDGRLVAGEAQRVRYGLAPGSSDLIGCRSVEVTPAMVGTTLAVLCAVEVKSARGRVTPEQAAFIRTVLVLGGRAGIARSVTEAQIIVDGGNSSL